MEREAYVRDNEEAKESLLALTARPARAMRGSELIVVGDGEKERAAPGWAPRDGRERTPESARLQKRKRSAVVLPHGEGARMPV